MNTNSQELRRKTKIQVIKMDYLTDVIIGMIGGIIAGIILRVCQQLSDNTKLNKIIRETIAIILVSGIILFLIVIAVKLSVFFR